MQYNFQNILKACALEYKNGMSAPVIKAYGEGHLAARILQIGRDNDILIREDETDSLLEVLKQLKINHQIPPEIYAGIARIFAFFYMKETGNLLK